MVKKLLFLPLVLVLSVVLISCNQTDDIASEKKVGDFILKVVSDKSRYHLNEDFNIQATLKYIGEEEVEISYLMSPFTFFVEGEHGVVIVYPERPKEKSYDKRVLKKDEIIEKNYTKAINIPEGDYTVKINAGFYNQKDKVYNIATELDIVVVEVK